MRISSRLVQSQDVQTVPYVCSNKMFFIFTLFEYKKANLWFLI